MSAAGPSVHAGCVVIGERGVLIRGASGAGKTSFAAALLARAREAGSFARLVSDDRTILTARHGRVIASCPAAIAGLTERRGLGIVQDQNLAESVLGLVIDLSPEPQRMPTLDALGCEIAGIPLPRLALDPRDPGAVGLALECLVSGRKAAGCGGFALAFAARHEKIAQSAS